MKFVKDNLVPLICGVVVLAALAAWYFVLVPKKEALQADMKNRVDEASMVSGMISKVTIPEGPTVETLEENVIDAYKSAQEDMRRQAEQISTNVSQHNHERRIKEVKDPKTGAVKIIPILGTEPMEFYLPKIDQKNAKRFGFKQAYENLVKLWERELVTESTTLTDKQLAAPPGNVIGQPPLDEEIRRVADAEAARARLAPGAAAAAAGGGSQDPQQLLEVTRRVVQNRAADIHMYVDKEAFQRQPWAGVAMQLPPNEPQIFEGLIESWCQQDVVRAILEVNKGAANVGQSPIKRLEKIIVGGGTVAGAAAVAGGTPTTTGASLFVNSGPATVGATPPLAGSPPGMDLGRTMTGRIGTTDYDVVVLTISIDLDPAYENRFIESLYKQNNGYTVINIKTTTADPLDAASKGFLYGNVQVVHLELQLEGLLFRSWTTPIMPDITKMTLGVGAAPPPPPPAQ